LRNAWKHKGHKKECEKLKNEAKFGVLDDRTVQRTLESLDTHGFACLSGNTVLVLDEDKAVLFESLSDKSFKLVPVPNGRLGPGAMVLS